MYDIRPLLYAVVVGEFKAEALRYREIQLRRGGGFLAAYYVFYLEIYLWAVERGFAFALFVCDSNIFILYFVAMLAIYSAIKRG